MIIGQQDLCRQFADAANIPNFIMLVGAAGQGKRTIASYIAQQLGAPLMQPEDLKVDNIRSIREHSLTLTRPNVYLLADAGRMTVQAQNALLKFAEEPVKDAYIVMTVQHPDEVLPTIKSRAKMYRLGYYTVTELQHFTDDELLLSVCENPGQIKRFELARIEHLMDHCNRILDSLDQIRASNVFRILSYVEPEELDLLLPLLIEALRQRAGGTERELWVDLLRIVYKYKGRMLIKGLNQQNLLETMLIEMRERAWTSET